MASLDDKTQEGAGLFGRDVGQGIHHTVTMNSLNPKFIRYPHKGMPAGEHTFTFNTTNPDVTETITVIAGP